jgi:hypothetical protein
MQFCCDPDLMASRLDFGSLVPSDNLENMDFEKIFQSTLI